MSPVALSLVLAGVGPTAEGASAAPDPACAMEPVLGADPEQLVAQAEEAFAAGCFEQVVVLAARAYELTGDPRHLYAQAVAERSLGHCPEALALYARVLASVDSGVLVEGAREGINECEPREPAPEVEPPACDSTLDPRCAEERGDGKKTEPPPPPPIEARPWHRDPAGGVMLGLGAALGGIVGTTLWVARDLRYRRAEEVEQERGLESEFAAQRLAGERLLIPAIVTSVVGGALVTAAVIRYAWVARRDRQAARPRLGVGADPGSSLSLSLSPRRGGVMLGWSRSF